MVEKIVILVLIGLLTGTITAISAGSGVMVVVPLLAVILGYTMHAAIGTSLLVDVIASINVAYSYYRYGRIELRSGIWLALGAIVGAQAGSRLASLIPQEGLQGGFSVFTILSGLSFFTELLGSASSLCPSSSSGTISIESWSQLQSAFTSAFPQDCSARAEAPPSCWCLST